MKQPPNKHNVFINCPFDEDFRLLFKALVFTLLYLDYIPLFSITKSSSSIRVKKIMNLIGKSMLGIHDLSRNQSKIKGEFSRFNMPFELGLDMGSKRFGSLMFAQKKILILDSKPHLYDKYIGDISGQDIESHENDPDLLIQKVRDWISRINPEGKIPGALKIITAFNNFKVELPKILSDDFTAYEVESLQMSDYIEYATDWIKQTKPSSK